MAKLITGERRIARMVFLKKHRKVGTNRSGEMLVLNRTDSFSIVTKGKSGQVDGNASRHTQVLALNGTPYQTSNTLEIYFPFDKKER